MVGKRVQRGKYFFKNYDWPNPYTSNEQFKKFIGADIEEMSELEVWQEGKRIEFLLAFSNTDDILHVNLLAGPGTVITRQNWLLKRLGKIRGMARNG